MKGTDAARSHQQIPDDGELGDSRVDQVVLGPRPQEEPGGRYKDEQQRKQREQPVVREQRRQ